MQKTSDNMLKRAFTLIEILVAVAILGIIAAIALPMIGDHTSQSKEAAAREALRILRSQAQLYLFEHQGLGPGYFRNPMGVKSQATITMLTHQIIGTSTLDGNSTAARIPAGLYRYGPYMEKLPVNPFNNRSTIKYVPSATAFSAAADKSTGWLYKKETMELRINWTGTDSQDKNYLDY